MERHLLRFGPALLLGVILALLVHLWGDNEQALCGASFEPCELGSGASWFMTGAMFVLPPLALLGFLWSRHLHVSGQSGPFAKTLIPDWEEQAEAIAFVLTSLFAYVLIRRGPKTPLTDAGRPNSWLLERLGEVANTPLAPSRLTWFVIGAALALSPAFALGSATGREWFRRMSQQPPSENGLSSETSSNNTRLV